MILEAFSFGFLRVNLDGLLILKLKIKNSEIGMQDGQLS